MKKTLFNITLLAAVLVAFSCSKNQPKAFSDDMAFVAFDKATFVIAEGVAQEDGTIAENPTTVKIPVTLGSVSGLTAEVPFEVKDGTAKAGVNYEVVTNGALSFNAENRTQYIEVKALYEDAYTGDLKFTINLKAASNVSLGLASSCTVTVSDLDHPLSALIGDYVAQSSTDAYQNPWTMTLLKDEDDDHVVWFFNIFANSGWAIGDTMYYGIAEEDADGNLVSITLPFGQSCVYKYGTSTISLYWLAADKSFGKDGSLSIEILRDGNGNISGLDFGEEYGITAQVDDYVNPDDWDEGWIGFADPHITAVKK